MTVADAILAALVVLAALAGFRAGATNVLASASAGSMGLVVGARLADRIQLGSASGDHVVSALVLLGCGAIGLAGGQLLRAAPAPPKPHVPVLVRRRRRRRWETIARTGLILLIGAVAGFAIAKATESEQTVTASVATLPATTAVTTAPPTTVVHSTFPSTAVSATSGSPSTVGTATTAPVTTASSAPPIKTLALSVTSPSDGTVVTNARVTISGTAEPGAIVKVGTVAVTAAADTTWRLVVRVDEGVNQVVVTDGTSSVTITVVFNAPPTTTTPTSTPSTVPPPTTTTIPVDTEPKP